MTTANQDERPITQPPPAGRRAPSVPAFVPSELLQSYIVSGGGILPASSVAYRDNPAWAEQMRLDAGIEGSLRNLRVTLAQLPWSIEIDEDRKDEPFLQALQDRITDAITNIPRLTDLRYALHGAKWYGLSVVNLVYGQPTEITDWMALDADSMAFDKFGNIGVKVGAMYLQDGGAGLVTTGFQGFVRVLDGMERDSVIVHRVFCEAPTFINANSAEMAFRGRGARDVCWYYWQMKQQVLRSLMAYSATYANGGIRKGWFPEGNESAKTTMMQILTQLDRVGSIALPFDHSKPGADQPWGMELLPMPAGTGEIYIKALDYFDRKCKEAILGQSLSSEAGADGFSGGVAKMHGDTFANELRYNAYAEAEAWTVDVVRVLAHRMGATADQAKALRFSTTVQQKDIKEFMESCGWFVDMGGTVGQEAVREKLGLPKPEATDTPLTPPASTAEGWPSDAELVKV